MIPVLALRWVAGNGGGVSRRGRGRADGHDRRDGHPVPDTRRRNEPRAQLPAEAPKSAPIGRYRDWIDLTGDIVAPVDVEWEAEVDPDRILDRSSPRSSGNAR